MADKPLVVGQKLWYVRTDSIGRAVKAAGTELTVIKIGKRWASLSYGRVDIHTMLMDGGQYASPGKCWLSQADYENEIAVRDLWHDFAIRLDRTTPPDGMTVEIIEQMARQCGICQHMAAATDSHK